MKENKLIRICLIGSCIGILAIYVISFSLVSQEYLIGDVNKNMIGQNVKLIGSPTNIYHHINGHMFFDLTDDSGSIKVVIWENVKEQLAMQGTDLRGLNKDNIIECSGEIELYKGELEIIPDSKGIKLI
jgi:aspartyl-tRNA synthetase